MFFNLDHIFALGRIGASNFEQIFGMIFFVHIYTVVIFIFAHFITNMKHTKPVNYLNLNIKSKNYIIKSNAYIEK